MSTQETQDGDFQEQSTARGGPSLLQIAWQRKSLVILGLMIGMVLGLLYYAQRQPIYQSSAQILVVKKSPDVLQGAAPGRDTYMEDYMGTQAALIRSPEIIKRAVLQLQELKSFPGERGEDLVYSIRDSLTVQRDTRDTAGAPNNILSISFRGPVAEECPLVVKAIIEAHQGFLNEVYKNVSTATTDLITKARNDLIITLEEKRKEQEAFRQTMPREYVPTPQGGMNIYALHLAEFDKERNHYRIKMKELEKHLTEVERAKAEKGKEDALYLILTSTLKLPLLEGNNEVRSKLLELQLKLDDAQQRLGLNHPEVKFFVNAIALYRQLSSQGMSLMTLDPTGSGDPNKKVDVVEVHVKAMKLQILTYKTLIETHTEMFEQDRQLARQLADLDAKDQGYREDIKTLRDVLDGIAKQLRVTEWIKDVGGYEAKTIAPPGALGGKVAPRAIQVFPIAAIAGLLAGLCLAYLAEISDKSFRTPAEIRRRLGLPVIGHIPFYVPDEKAAKRLAAGEAVVDPMICTHYASNSLSSEAYRSVRTALYFNTQGVGHQVIQVTSPNVSDGKSTLAANLAVSIAQSGKRTILIDADCRRPRAHKIFGLTAETGLASVIAGQADLASAIQQTQVANLSLLPCGPRPANPSELLTSPRFKELLDIIRAQYDFVIVDTPPLLVVTDPCVVAPRVDGVIMAIRVTKNGRPFAERAKEILASLGANVLGVVVNGLGSQTGGRYGYGYDQYGYGYQYGYTYRYSYTYADEYSDDKAASYYRDEPATPAIPPAPAASADAPAAERSE